MIVSRPRKYDTVEERRTAQDDSRKRQRQIHLVDFQAVDGEGVGKWRSHRYVLLGCGQSQTEVSAGIDICQAFTFLYDQFLLSPDAAFVGFFLGYDFNQLFKTLPENRARALLTEAGRIKRQRETASFLGPFPVEYAGWQFDILGMKRLKLRPLGEKGQYKWMYICDAGSFFQASLMSVIDPTKWSEPVVSPEEYATLLEGKSKRDTASLDDDMRRYTRLENTVLARLMDRLNQGFSEAGIKLKKSQWFGPGQAAQAWLSTTELPSRIEMRESLPDVALDRGRFTYYGGWFEIFAHGHIPGQSWEYDINSAYPYIASKLPCLLHGTWTHGVGLPGKLAGNAIRIVHATVTGSDRHLGAMLHRTAEGSIRRPSYTRGWYWQTEIDAAIRANAVDSVSYIEWSEYQPCDCRPPLRGLVGLYDKRLRVGKNTPAGKSYKLIYNSVYGKLAQSVGSPKYGNALYASLITSGCRTMILDAMASHPAGSDALLMVATDGVYFTSPHPTLAISMKIGEWDESVHENLTLFKPGVYWDDRTRESLARGDAPEFKSRGISARDFASSIAVCDNEFAKWGERFPLERDPLGTREGWYPKVTFTAGFSMVTCQQALQWDKWFLAGAVTSKEVTQDADPASKRHSGWLEHGIYWSSPYPDGGSLDEESTPYDRRFGQPDPDEYGITDDGTVMDGIRGLLYEN